MMVKGAAIGGVLAERSPAALAFRFARQPRML